MPREYNNVPIAPSARIGPRCNRVMNGCVIGISILKAEEQRGRGAVEISNPLLCSLAPLLLGKYLVAVFDYLFANAKARLMNVRVGVPLPHLFL